MDQKDNHKSNGQTQEENLLDKIHSKNWLGRLIVSQLTIKNSTIYGTKSMSKQYFYFAYQPPEVDCQSVMVWWLLVGNKRLICPPLSMRSLILKPSSLET
jgi:hypothetical protein